MWILRYAREVATWAFARWRVHQAALGVLVILVGLIGVTRLTAQSYTISVYLASWLAFLVLIVAPARLWNEQDKRLKPRVDFVEHEDDYAVDVNSGTQYARLTVRNRSAILLTGVEVMLAAIDPRPDDFMTLHVPLLPMHASLGTPQFALQPEMQRSINVLSLDINSPYAAVWHVVDAVPRQLPLGRYRIKLIVSTDQTPPKEQWFKVEISRRTNGQTLSIEREG
jgi:hypothetical protein